MFHDSEFETSNATPERLEEVVGEIAMGRSMLER